MHVHTSNQRSCGPLKRHTLTVCSYRVPMTTYRGAVAVMAVCCAALVCPALAGGRVMPWLCLERCDDNITNDLAQLSEHYQALSAVSFESYDVAADGGLLDDHFTVVDPGMPRERC